jgi:putative transcriptional regulator
MKPNAWSHSGEKPQPPLRYPECGLEDVYLVSGYEIVKTPHGDGLAIKNLDKLHKAIGCYLAKRKKALSGNELRFLRKQMDLTQSELGILTGLSSQQVARWEKGESDISGPADVLIRALFIQHAGGAVDLQQLAKRLDEIDAPVNDKTYFEPTAQGWKLQKAA